MSDRKALNYRQVVCECPSGHLLGTILETQTGLWWGARPLRDGRRVDTTPLPHGEKVKAICDACRRGTDYQASWNRVAEKLKEARDAQAERVKLVFG
jgi:hypothetical protein